MEPLYRTYILNQSHALEHYHRLSQTFQFDVYFPQSQILAHKASNAWDLPSLLIKPVQRLLHYPQLLAAIIAETPDSHGDKANLVEAHARIGELVRGLSPSTQLTTSTSASTSTTSLPAGTHTTAPIPKAKALNIGRALRRLPARVASGAGRGHSNDFTPIPGEQPIVMLRVWVLSCTNLSPKARNGFSDP